MRAFAHIFILRRENASDDEKTSSAPRCGGGPSAHSRSEQDDCRVRAVEHPLVDVIGHLSGRKIERRSPYSFDAEAVIEACAASGTMLEINASPDRRDLNEINARAAAGAGVPILINCDAHRVGGFSIARYGVATARRAWLTAEQVANTRPWPELAGMRKRSQSAAA